MFCFSIFPFFDELDLGKHYIIPIINYPIFGDLFMSETPDLQPLLVKAKCKNCTLEELFERHRAWIIGFERCLVCRDWNWVILNQSRERIFRGIHYIKASLITRVRSLYLRPAKHWNPRSWEVQAACHTEITSLSICHLNVDIIWSVPALKEPWLFPQTTELLPLWDGLETDQLFFFWSTPTSLGIALETEVIICSREPNRRFLIIKWKKWEGPFLQSNKRSFLFWERKRFDGERGGNDSAEMVFGSRHCPIKKKFFLVCLFAVLATAPGNTMISVASGHCQNCLLLVFITFLQLPTFFMNKHTYFFLESLHFRFSTESENLRIASKSPRRKSCASRLEQMG